MDCRPGRVVFLSPLHPPPGMELWEAQAGGLVLGLCAAGLAALCLWAEISERREVARLLAADKKPRP